MANEAQKTFLLDIGCRNFPDEESIVWLVENILANLAEDDCQILKAKYALDGVYINYTEKDLAGVFQITIGEFRVAFGRAISSARVALRELNERKEK